MLDAEPRTLLDGLRTGDWLDGQVFPPVSWFVDGLLPEGLSLLVGGPKIGKSWLTLDIALSVASGGRVLGKVTTAAQPVLLLALEDGDRRLQERSRTLLGRDKIPAGLHYMTRIESGLAVPTIEEWLSTLDDEANPLVILDTLGKVMPPTAPGESSYQRDYRVAGRLKSICDGRPGMALVVVHHDRKAVTDDFVDSVSGTNGIAGAADTIVVISRSRTETDGVFRVTGRDVEEAEYAVTINGGKWSLNGSDLSAAADVARTRRATEGLADRSSEIVRFVAKHPNGVRAGDVAEAIGINKNDASRYLTRLHDAGKLRRPERGLYACVFSVVSVLSDELPLPGTDTKDTSDTGPDGAS